MLETLHPIQVVARRAGVTPHVLRAWEKRYGVVEPVRSPGGRRLYSEADIERLRLLQAAVAGGRRIGDVVTLTPDALRAIVEGDYEAGTGAGSAQAPDVARILETAITAVLAMDGLSLRTTLGRGIVLLPAAVFLEQLIVPLLHRIGTLWAAGTLTPGHEHLATGIVREELGELMRRFAAPPDAPRLVVATPASQRHELGALVVAAAAALDGWQVSFLGADLPAADIARAALTTGAHAVAVSVTTNAHPSLVERELHELATTLPATATLLVGGQSAQVHAAALRARGAVIVDDLSHFRDQLAARRADGA